jgi:hypothetical protein
MSPRPPETDLRDLWQDLETEKTTVSTEQLQRRALATLKKNRLDMIGRLVFALFGSAYCGFVVVRARETPIRIVAAVIMVMILGGAIRRLYLSYREGVPSLSSMDFYRRELEKQRAFASTPAWQILTAFLIIGWQINGLRVNGSAQFVTAVLVAAAGLVVLLAARRFRVRRIQDELDALSSFEEEK